MNYLLEAKNITKTYNTVSILQDVSLSIKKGHSIALVGANGCGKSTLLRILSGLTKPTKGIVATADNLRLAFIPDHFEKINLTTSAFMKYNLEMDKHRKLTDTLTEYYSLFQLHHLIHIPMKYLSKGSLQKIAVIQALIQDADLLFLDEPLSGQDTMSRLCFIEKLLEKKKRGTTIVMACHEKDMIEEVSDEIILIKQGKLCDGENYLYNNNELSLLLFEIGMLDNNKHHQTIINMIEQLNSDAYFTSYQRIGKKYRITINKSKSADFLKLCLQHNIHIIKYEEIY